MHFFVSFHWVHLIVFNLSRCLDVFEFRALNSLQHGRRWAVNENKQENS